MKYNIDPALRPIVEMMPPADPPSLLDINAARENVEKSAAMLANRLNEEPLEIRNQEITGYEDGNKIMVRVYDRNDKTGDTPATLYIHGGGFASTDHMRSPARRSATSNMKKFSRHLALD